MTLATAERALEEYCVWLSVERGRAPRTVEAYRRDLASYLAYLEARDLAPLTVIDSDLVAYLRSLQAADLAASSVASVTC